MRWIFFFFYIFSFPRAKTFADFFVELPKWRQNFHFHLTQKSLSVLVNHCLSEMKSTLLSAALSSPPGASGGGGDYSF